MKRRKMGRRENKRNFKKGNGVHRKNNMSSMRGGIRF